MKMFRHLSSVFAIATIAPLALAATLAATPAIAQADQLPNPDWVALLSDYEKNYWQAPTDAGHGGKVLHADTMKLDEDLAVAINHKAAENLDKDGLNAQRKRALVDSDLQAEETMPDALGPVLGKYMSEGLKSEKLNAVADIFSFNVASTYASKRAAMHPRPYLNRAESSYGGTNDLAGLPATLDIMGGRIGASAQNGQYWHNEFASSIVPASRQLRDYLVSRCAADGHGTTLAACIANTKASGSGGYTNVFLDPVATEPVADQASAVRVYTARLTYTFPQDTAQSGADFVAPRGAADVLRLAYPELHADQRNAILKATALDSGYPLWQSSDGWQRINWAKALCARVTLDKHGDVAKVETADQVALAGPSVVNAQYIDAGNHPASDSLAGENSAIAAGPDLATLHAVQRPALISVAIGTAVIAIIGGIRTVRRKSKNQLQQ